MLDGDKRMVLHGGSAETLVVSARTSGGETDAAGITLFLVPRTAPGVSVKEARTIDNLRSADITFTNVRMSLVRTDMIGPTGIYRKAPALTPEQAALKIVRALEDRPVSVDPLPARVIDVLNLAAPRLADVLFHGVDLMFPESRAARRHLGD